VQEVHTGFFRPQRKHILVSKLDHMGDLVLAIPAVMKLRARYPYARIDALVGSWNVDAVRLLGVFDRVHVFDFFAKESSKVATERAAALAVLTSAMEKYDLAIDLRRQRDTRFILLKVPARVYAGYASGDESVDARMDVCLPAVPDEPFVTTKLNRVSIARQMLNLIDALPADVNDYIRLPELGLHPPQRHGRIAVFPKAGNDVKEWGDHNFMALISLLVAAPEVSAITVYTLNANDSGPYRSLVNPKVRILSGLSYGELLNSLSSHLVCVANNSFGAHIASYLGLRVVGVYAGHETVAEWAPVFGDVSVIHTPVECSPCHISHREQCQYDLKCLVGISPEYVCTVARRMLVDDGVMRDLLSALASKAAELSESELLRLADCVARTFPLMNGVRQLFVDISELVQRDAKSGIQRVVRSILKKWLNHPLAGYQLEPVYATVDRGYRYARRFTQGFLGCPDDTLQDETIDYAPGDIFFGLDLQPQVQVAQREFYQVLRRQGVQVRFVVYDLLCVLMPQHFPDGADAAFANWIDVVGESDGAVCISQSVANELSEWVKHRGHARQSIFVIDWFHLGADIGNSHPTMGIPEDAETPLSQLCIRPSFLMVGTLEPRKGHAQVLDAFEHLWCSGQDINLVIVGKQGWMVEELVSRLRKHPELNNRLFLLGGISDEYLEKVYAVSTCLIAASFGEGFGLPLIEAAQHKLPIIVRDIPVFREVAGEHAYYFDGNTPEALAQAIEAWLGLYKSNQYPKSDAMPWLTWKQSAARLMQICINKAISSLRV